MPATQPQSSLLSHQRVFSLSGDCLTCPTISLPGKSLEIIFSVRISLVNHIVCVPRAELERLPNNTACDIIGLVKFVGRVERVKNKGNKGKYFNHHA